MLLATGMYDLVAIFSLAGAMLNALYLIRYRGRRRSLLHATHGIAAIYVFMVTLLILFNLVTMRDVAGYLMLLGMIFLLASGLAGAIIDL